MLIRRSIESNVIIVASCIPTLGPIYELVRGKRSWSSYQRYYNKNSNPGGRSASFDRGFRKPSGHGRKHDGLMTTDIGTVQNDSQEMILEGHHALGEIRRTDKVMVEYEVRQEA